MPKDLINGVGLRWDLCGRDGPTMALVHGAWIDGHDWDDFVPHVSDRYRVLSYDRRGHGDSDRPGFQGRMRDDVDELAGLLTHLDLAPAHIVGNSYGGMIALRMAVHHPDSCLSVTAHEPPFLHLNDRIREDPLVAEMDEIQRKTVELLGKGEMESSIGSFMNAVLAPDVWDDFPEDFRAYLRSSAPSFVDDVNDPEPWAIDLYALRRFTRPIVLTRGALSPSSYGVILDEIARAVPTAHQATIDGAGHTPHSDRPAEYADIVLAHIS